MKIAYFDCFAGISGDMVLGALIDAGLDPDLLRAELSKLQLSDVDIDFSSTSRQAIGATKASVRLGSAPISPQQEHHIEPPAHEDNAEAHGHRHDQGETRGDHGHRHLTDILTRIRGSGLDPQVEKTSVRIFQRLAAAESRVHGADPAQVHLHEVGAIDAIVDIVGAVVGLHLLGIDRVYSSPLRLGTGFVRCAHGRYPVPVPGVLALCAEEGVLCEQTDIRAELVTPTGAAIITTIAAGFGPPPPFHQTQIGYGAGGRDLEEIPNLLRIRIGETAEKLESDRMVLLEANIDDMNPEVYGYLFDLLLERGARDVFTTPIHMKKGRPANLLSVLVEEDRLDTAIDTVLAETTTIGVRYHPVARRKLKRSSRTVSTPYGPVRVKVCQFGDRTRTTPEYDDCALLARQKQVPILEVYAAASAAPEEE